MKFHCLNDDSVFYQKFRNDCRASVVWFAFNFLGDFYDEKCKYLLLDFMGEEVE